MSYARFGADGSDVYVFLNEGGYLDCCGCSLIGISRSRSFSARRTGEMVSHLGEHRSAGHTVPQSTIDGLNRDWDENDAWMSSAVSGAQKGTP